MKAAIGDEVGPLRADRAGALCSAACAVHCASVALFPGMLGAFGVGVLAGSAMEWGLTIVATALAVFAFMARWRRHRTVLVAATFSLGVIALLGNRLLEAFEINGASAFVGIGAAGCLVCAHLLNIRAARRSAE